MSDAMWLSEWYLKKKRDIGYVFLSACWITEKPHYKKAMFLRQIVFHSVLCTLSHVAETLAPHKRFQHDIIAKFSNCLK